MVRTGKMGLCLATLLATGAITAASASAAEYELENPPEFGRCVKVAPKTGAFSGSHCIKPSAGKGKYNWLPGPGEKPKFVAAVEETFLNATGTGKPSITCAFGEAEGEYTGPKTLTLKKIVFQNCQKAGAKTATESWCQNVGAFRGEVSTKELAGELGYIQHVGNKTKVGLDLKAATAKALAMFECGGAEETIPMVEIGTGLGTLYEIEGSVIGRVKFLNKMTEENLVTYSVKSGVQVPEQFEGGVKDTPILLTGVTKTAEPATIATLAEVENEEALEIKSR